MPVLITTLHKKTINPQMARTKRRAEFLKHLGKRPISSLEFPRLSKSPTGLPHGPGRIVLGAGDEVAPQA